MLYYKTYRNNQSDQWVAFIHGAGGSSSIWFRQIKSFKEKYNVLLLDLRGHGKSQEAFQRYFTNDHNFENISKDIIEVLDHLKIEKAHFVGVSLGTIIVRTICEIAPGRVQSLILAGAVTRLNIRSKFLMSCSNAVKRFIPFLWLYTIFAFIIMPRKRNEESRTLFVNQAKRVAQHEFMKWFQLTNGINPVLRYFNEKETGLPTLYLMGDEDYMFLPQVRKLVSHHDKAWLNIIENCGHVCNVEQPDTFNDLSIAFIKTHSA
ncbi:MAG: pimeloyl-ACP methyl ester carboxylesterase [Roseivirga sp.]